mmetsp:Transcript_39462/g.98810  ORF Transcript_39462/g.98810 Transcript_39462/m.98810 type:complete len:376 (-) Transcript_39462:55-1182(-)
MMVQQQQIVSPHTHSHTRIHPIQVKLTPPTLGKTRHRTRRSGTQPSRRAETIAPCPASLFGLFLFGWWRAALGSAHLGRPQHPLLDAITALQHVNHRAFVLRGVFDFEERLVLGRVEPLTHWGVFLDVEVVEGFMHLRLGQLDAVVDLFQLLVRPDFAFVDVVGGQLQAVGNVEHGRRKLGDAILVGILNLSLVSDSGVLLLSEAPHEFVLELLDLLGRLFGGLLELQVLLLAQILGDLFLLLGSTLTLLGLLGVLLFVLPALLVLLFVALRRIIGKESRSSTDTTSRLPWRVRRTRRTQPPITTVSNTVMQPPRRHSPVGSMADGATADASLPHQHGCSECGRPPSHRRGRRQGGEGGEGRLRGWDGWRTVQQG